MEIKGVHEIYKALSPATTSNLSAKSDSTTLNSKNDNNGYDTVSISPRGSFQSKINTEIKKYALAAQTDMKESENRIQSLKSQYYGDNCPVPSSLIAGAIMGKVCGINF